LQVVTSRVISPLCDAVLTSATASVTLEGGLLLAIHISNVQ
jgi:hypothetical protein